MKNLFKFAALGLALTAGLSSCESKKTEATTVETPATGAATTTTETSSTMSADTTKMAAPAADGKMDGAMAPAAGTTTTTTEVKK